MTTLHKRRFFQWAAISALSALTLSACGDKPAEPVAAAPGPAPAPAPQASTPHSTPSLKVAFAYIGPVGDGGWTFAHDQARKRLQAALGNQIETTIVESVPEGADAERVLRDLASQGNTLIFGTTFGYMDTIQKLATEFPEVKWEHATGYKTAPNVQIGRAHV